MEVITRPSITRLARRGGVKSLSDDCYTELRSIIHRDLLNIVQATMIVNSEHQTKTLMPSDVYEAMRLLGHNIAQSTELGTSTCGK